MVEGRHALWVWVAGARMVWYYEGARKGVFDLRERARGGGAPGVLGLGGQGLFDLRERVRGGGAPGVYGVTTHVRDV